MLILIYLRKDYKYLYNHYLDIIEIIISGKEMI